MRVEFRLRDIWASYQVRINSLSISLTVRLMLLCLPFSISCCKYRGILDVISLIFFQMQGTSIQLFTYSCPRARERLVNRFIMPVETSQRQNTVFNCFHSTGNGKLATNDNWQQVRCSIRIVLTLDQRFVGGAETFYISIWPKPPERESEIFEYLIMSNLGSKFGKAFYVVSVRLCKHLKKVSGVPSASHA